MTDMIRTTQLQLLKRFAQRHSRARRYVGRLIRPFRLIDNARLRTEARILNNLASLLDEDPIVRIQEFQGLFAVDPRSDLFKRLVAFGEYEPRLVARCLEFINPKKDVVDVGANIGFYSVLCAQRIHSGQQVLAIEPTESALRRLRRNLELNGLVDRVIVVPGIVGSVSGKTHVNIIPGREEYSTSGPLLHPSAKNAEYVQQETNSFTLDQLVGLYNLNPGFIKVDVEGGEGAVFRGAAETIKAFKPTILSELSDPLLRAQGYRAQDIINEFRALGYKVVDPQYPELPPGVREYGDILCTLEGGSTFR